jgi:UTP:GlnB (protein PII) uridylyltransferase
MTVGERAEDVFYITNRAGNPLDDAARAALEARLVERIDQHAR